MDEMDVREKAIEWIEGATGCYQAIWHEWKTSEIIMLYAYVCEKEGWKCIPAIMDHEL